MADEFESIVKLKNCIFKENAAGEYGGAIYLFSSGNFTFENCTFDNNKAKYGGAIYYDDDISNGKFYLILIYIF